MVAYESAAVSNLTQGVDKGGLNFFLIEKKNNLKNIDSNKLQNHGSIV